MLWKNHSKEIVEGSHAFLSPSKYHWLNYDDEKMVKTYRNRLAAIQGTNDHEFAALCIKRRQKLPGHNKTLAMYVNDAIGFGMDPEVPLYFSQFCYGTADAISYKKNFLRIHDLKTGETVASLHQLEIYAALFFLDYQKEVNMKDVKGIELRIYQNNDILIGQPEVEDILPIMDKIVHATELLIECGVD